MQHYCPISCSAWSALSLQLMRFKANLSARKYATYERKHNYKPHTHVPSLSLSLSFPLCLLVRLPVVNKNRHFMLQF